MTTSVDYTKTLGGGAIQVLDKSAVAVSCPADTSEDILASITIPAGAMGPNGSVRITAQWSMTNNGNVKAARVRFSGLTGTLYTLHNTLNIASLSTITQIWNRNSASSQVGNGLVTASAASTVSNNVTTSAENTNAATTIAITGQKAVAGDTLTLESYTVELMYGA